MLSSSKISYSFHWLLVTASILCSIPIEAQTYVVSPFPHNSKEADFSAVFVGDDVIFCSSRSRKTTNYNLDSAEVFYTDLYYVKYDSSGKYLEPELLKGNVNTFYNEGHATISSDGLTMYYTANLMSKGGKSSKVDEFKLGIFIAQNHGGEWVKTGEFEFNSKNGKFSTAHPFLTDGDNTLYFASNRPGGHGGSDIYRCYKTPSGWSEPENLGAEVNSEGNEFFPFVNQERSLYFTTDGRVDSEGMDIYCCYASDNNQFEPAFRLDNTINSPLDELAYFEKPNSNKGLFSSNRIKEQDDIFLFTKMDDPNRRCVASEVVTNCYRFTEEKISQANSSDNFTYEWWFGDGNQVEGNMADHCYDKPGVYRVVLNAIDSATHMKFLEIGEATIVVSSGELPSILSPDTIHAGQPFESMIALNQFTQFDVLQYIWSCNDQTSRGDNVLLNIPKPGLYQIKCELKGNRSDKKRCVYKTVVCIDPPANINLNEPLKRKSTTKPIEVVLTNGSIAAFCPINEENNKQIFLLIVAESATPLTAEDESFLFIPELITEVKTDSGYIYTVAQNSDWRQLISPLMRLRDHQFESAYVRRMEKSEYKTCQFHALKPAVPLTNVSPQSKSDAPSDQPINRSTGASKVDLQPTESNTAMVQMDSIARPEKLIVENSIALSDSMVNHDDFKTTEQVKRAAPNELGNVHVKNSDRSFGNTNDSDSHLENEFVLSKPASLSPIPRYPRKQITLYQIVLDTAVQRMEFNDVYFQYITTEIAESKTPTGYKYTVLTAPQPHYLESPLAELKQNGYANARIASYDLQDFSDHFIRMGKFNAPVVLNELKRQFDKLQDIRFDYNSSEILESSFDELDYIASIMTLEEAFVLKINAHSCNIGNSEYNRLLSEKRANAVKEYLMDKGISANRLLTTSYGDRMPAVSNFTVDGRSTNRRVEFVIVYK